MFDDEVVPVSLCGLIVATSIPESGQDWQAYSNGR